MKRLLAVCVCLCLLFSIFLLPAHAEDGFELPNGGSGGNNSHQRVYGKTSGGADGHVNLVCYIDKTNSTFFLTPDKVTATMESDVSSGFYAHITVVAWYVTTSGTEKSSNNGGVNEIYGSFSVTATAGNANGNKGTAGYAMETDTRGSWLAATSISW